jgi:hypothetical protein
VWGLARATDGAHTLAGGFGPAYDLMMINRSHVESRLASAFGRLFSAPLAAVVLLFAAVATVAGTGCASSAAAPAALDARQTESRKLASEMALRAMDREALYTVAPTEGGTRIKALSTGFWQSKLDAAAPKEESLRELEARRRALDLLDTGELDFGVMAFTTVFDGQRHVEAYVVHVGTMDDVLSRHSAFFGPYGLTRGTSVGEVLATVERMPRLDRFRAYGLLFGYPQYAVDFFVEAARDEVKPEGSEEGKGAGKEASEASRGGEAAARRPIVPRDFVSIPVHESETNRFVWAAPKGHAGHPDDEAIRAQAAAILARYRAARGEAPADGVVLLRVMSEDPGR